MIFIPAVSIAEDDWHFCARPFVPSELDVGIDFKATSDNKKTLIEAQNITSNQQETLTLSGEVRIQKGSVSVTTDHALYSVKDQRLSTTGGIRFEADQLITVGDTAEFDFKSAQGKVSNVRFWLARTHLRGNASELIIENENLTTLKDSTFTSCLEGNSDWELKASDLAINSEKNEGVAQHARLSFKGFPIFYFPYLSFPLQGRKSGLLMPELGNSNKTGRHLRLPYYINIAPNRDATITPHYYQTRGIMFETQYRYLQPHSEGQIEFNYLNNDKEFHDDRFFAKYQLESRPTEHWRATMDINRVSDSTYFSDYGESFEEANVSHLEQFASADYHGDLWRVDTLVQTYQTIGELATDPYKRLPNIHVDMIEQRLFGGVQYDMAMDFVRFDRDEGVVGSRLDLAPRLRWPVSGSAGFIEPAVTLRHTSYSLAHQHPDFDATTARDLSQWQIDSGLYFERSVKIGGVSHIHTLEPRLYYLYVPYRDQSELIVDSRNDKGEVILDTNGNIEPNYTVFDSGQPTLSFAQLFRNNRFTGLDRIGDAKQFTTAVTSRIMTDTGRERFRLSMGQIHYLDDRKVVLSEYAVDPQIPSSQTSDPADLTNTQSDLIVELASQWDSRFSAQATYLWHPQTDETQSSLYRIHYQYDKNRMVSVNYRFQQQVDEQADATFLWRFRFRWKGIFHVRYSLREDDTLEHYEGLEYQSCCWSVRLLQRDYLTDDGSTHNRSLWLQLELKGLTRIGQKLGDVFATGQLAELNE